MNNNTQIVDIDPNNCQIIKVLNSDDNWIVAKVKAKLLGGKRWKIRKVLLTKSEFRQIKLNNVISNS
jgi:hypothetical protein